MGGSADGVLDGVGAHYDWQMGEEIRCSSDDEGGSTNGVIVTQHRGFGSIGEGTMMDDRHRASQRGEVQKRDGWWSVSTDL